MIDLAVTRRGRERLAHRIFNETVEQGLEMLHGKVAISEIADYLRRQAARIDRLTDIPVADLGKDER